MERNLQLVLAYDGADFHGWQAQRGVRTVQQEVEHVLRHVLRHPLHVDGASRTDTGVHARGQVACVHTTTPIPLERLGMAIGHHLPPDVALVQAAERPLDFHPGRAARSKLYRYRIFHSRRRPVEFLANHHTWHVWYPLSRERMQAAADALLGTHDFAGFASEGSPRPTTVRTLLRFEVRSVRLELWIDVEGDGFLYHQVRNLVGTLVEIGRGHWPVERTAEILAARDRRLAGPTAPAQGLCLQWVRYDPTPEVQP